MAKKKAPADKENISAAINDLQGIVNEMQEINKSQAQEICRLQTDNNRLSVTNELQERKIKLLMSNEKDLHFDLADARIQAENYKTLLFAERNKTWWDKLWE